jgi:hypothetical protein
MAAFWSSPAAAGQAAEIAALKETVSQISAGLNSKSVDTGVLLHGFADVGAGWSQGNDPIKLRMTGAYVGYDENDWEVIAECYRTSNAWFAQAGKTFGQFTPFVRLENAALNANDNFFRSQSSGRSYKRAGVGRRYALDAKSSLKAEFASTRENAVDQLDENGASAPFSAPSYMRLAVQYSVSF